MLVQVFYSVQVLLLLLAHGVNQGNELYDRCQDQKFSEGETAQLTFQVLNFHKISFYLTRGNDVGTRIIFDDGNRLTVYDNAFQTEGLQHDVLKVRIPNVTLEYTDKYILTTYVNGEPNITYYCFLAVTSQNETSAKDENPKDPPHTLEKNRQQNVLLGLLGGCSLLLVTFIAITVYCLKYRKKSVKPGDDIANEEARGRLNQTGLELESVTDGETSASRGNETSACLSGQQ